ncbi:MAG: hypothetical protein WCG81_21245 [Candidatus Angelobacter sp.]
MKTTLLLQKDKSRFEAFADGSCDETRIFENRHACQRFGCLGKELSNSIDPVMA